MKRPALVPATKGLTLPVGGSGPATSRDTTVPLSAGVTDVHVAPPSTLSYRGGPAAEEAGSLPATRSIGTWTAATPSRSMVVVRRPDCFQAGSVWPDVTPVSRP